MEHYIVKCILHPPRHEVHPDWARLDEEIRLEKIAATDLHRQRKARALNAIKARVLRSLQPKRLAKRLDLRQVLTKLKRRSAPEKLERHRRTQRFWNAVKDRVSKRGD